MIRLYRAADLMEAWLLRDLLTQEGIRAVVFNEHAQGGAGQLPVTETYPEVWLEEVAQLIRAKAVVTAFERRGSGEHEDHFCPVCGEANPGTFELCWHCGGAL